MFKMMFKMMFFVEFNEQIITIIYLNSKIKS